MQLLYPAAPLRYVHERYLGRPSCPKCGELIMAPGVFSLYGGPWDSLHVVV